MKPTEEKRSALSEINVTPFVDVMLVLLIIFMVTAPMLQYGVNVELPESSRKTIDTPSDQVILSIDRNRKIFVDRYEVSLRDLKRKLEAVYTGRSQKEIFLQADKNVPYGFVVQTMAAIKAAGIENMGLITESPD